MGFLFFIIAVVLFSVLFHVKAVKLDSSFTSSSIISSVSNFNSTVETSNYPFPNGVNFQPSYYCSGEQNLGWSLMKSYPKISSIRIELEDPSSSSDVNDFIRWISEAQGQGKFVIATYHRYPYLGSNDINVVLNAAYWWKDNYQKLGGNFMINLINEWGDHTLSAQDYANAYNQAISIVRQVYSGYIIIDIPGWGQEFYTAASASSLLKDQKIIFSAHIYPQAYDSQSNSAPTTKNMDVLHATGRPCMIGEFGTDQPGGCDWSTLVDYGKTLGWPILGWAWNGDGGLMNMISPSWSSSCSTTNYSPAQYFNTVYDKL